MALNVLMHDIRTLDTEALFVGLHQDVRPLKGAAGAVDWLLCGALSRLLIKGRLRGAVGDVALLTTGGKVPATKVFMIGLGPRASFDAAALRSAVRSAAAAAAGAGVKSMAVDCFPLGQGLDAEALKAVREGLAEGASGRPLDVVLLAQDAPAFERMSRLIRT